MAEREVAPYGSWRSPISSDSIVRGVVGLSEVVVDDTDVYWMESRPGEDGRNVIVVRTPEGSTGDVTPQPFDARTRVHEYGGGEIAVHAGTVYFSNFADQRIYRCPPGFRRAQNIRRALDGELYFYSRIFGFDLADPIEPIPIENL